MKAVNTKQQRFKAQGTSRAGSIRSRKSLPSAMWRRHVPTNDMRETKSAKQRRSQSRQDRWAHRLDNESLKEKYREFREGGEQFLESLDLSHRTISEQINRRWNDDNTNQSLPHFENNNVNTHCSAAELRDLQQTCWKMGDWAICLRRSEAVQSGSHSKTGIAWVFSQTRGRLINLTV